MINLQRIKTLYKLGKEFTLNDINLLRNAATQKSYAANSYILKEGSRDKLVFSIQKGLVRNFVITESGKEITVGLKVENELMANLDMILFDRKSRSYLQALEPTTIISIQYDVVQNIIAANPKLEVMRKHIFQKVMRDAYERIAYFTLYSPEERYIKYVEQHPDMINRVPSKYIANILGITPVSLSRIRKRIAVKKARNRYR